MNKIDTVFIPAAGLGSRVSDSKITLPKPLRSIGSKPLLSRVMELYPEKTQFLIGLGFKGDWVLQVAEITATANNQSVDFFITNSWESPNKGLTDTVMDAKRWLQRSFIFHAVDTLIPANVILDLLEQEDDLILVSPPANEGDYRTIEGQNWTRKHFLLGSNENAYIGVAAIKDFASFWRNLDLLHPANPDGGETLGIDPRKITTKALQKNAWIDCGNEAGIKDAQLRNIREDVVLERSDEAIWHIGSEMIKFHIDEDFISKRIARAKSLFPFVPLVIRRGKNTYSYTRETGKTLSEAEPEEFSKFLAFLKEFWQLKIWDHGPPDPAKVSSEYLEFYQVKTRVRVEAFLKKHPEYYVKNINGVPVKTIEELLDLTDWQNLAKVQLARVHGDLHPDNVLAVKNPPYFILLDWRQDIAGNVQADGDLYYDLAKIKHGLIVDHTKVSKSEFFVRSEEENALIQMEQTEKKKNWEIEFHDFLKENNLDLAKVNLITALIFLNIACLHHVPYDSFLFILGHKMLDDCIS